MVARLGLPAADVSCSWDGRSRLDEASINVGSSGHC